jgi:hypothetical protein
MKKQSHSDIIKETIKLDNRMQYDIITYKHDLLL